VLFAILLHGLYSALFVSHSSLLAMKSVDFMVGTLWLPFVLEMVYNFIVATSIAEVLFKDLLIHTVL